MTGQRCVWPAWAAGVLLAAGAGHAQQLDIDTVRKQPAINQAAREVIGKWLGDKLRELQATDERARIAELTSEILQPWRAQDTSPAFRQAFAATLVATVSKFLQDSKPDHARAMVRMLAQAASPDALDTCLKALGHADAAVRYWAAAAVAALHGKLTPSDVQKAVGALRDAGRKEPEPLVVRQIYRAMGFNMRTEQATTAVLAVVDARLKRYESAPARWSDAELEAIRVLDELQRNLPERIKVQIVQTLAKVLRAAWARYATGPQEPEASNLERIIEDAEGLLKRIVRGAGPATRLPDVAGAMKNEPKERKIDAMKLALNEWIGTDRSEGVLNRAPWNVPRQAGATSQPAPPGAPSS